MHLVHVHKHAHVYTYVYILVTQARTNTTNREKRAREREQNITEKMRRTRGTARVPEFFETVPVTILMHLFEHTHIRVETKTSKLRGGFVGKGAK